MSGTGFSIHGDHLDLMALMTPIPTGARGFDDGVLKYDRGSTPCGTISLLNGRGDDMPMLTVNTADASAWGDGMTAPWETWICFEDAAGAKAASRVARWLLRSDPDAPLLVDGRIGILVGSTHAERACWKRITQVAPFLIQPMPSGGAVTLTWEASAQSPSIGTPEEEDAA